MIASHQFLAGRERRARAPLQRVLVFDPFNRADNASSLGNADTGQAWSALSGTWGTVGNTGYKAASNAVDQVAVINAGLANVSVSVRMATVGGASNFAGLTLRATDVNNFLVAFYDFTASKLSLDSCVAGLFTDLAIVTSFTIADGDVLKATMLGTSIIISVNGVAKITTTSAVGQTATGHGLFTNKIAPRFDNFLVTTP